jgi:hypothetical protein
MKLRFYHLALLLLIAAGAQPGYSAVWQWSHTASTNATIDPTINWAEGMSPSSVNDSARAMMARTADYRDDISGSVVSAGSGTAYTLSTNQLAGGNGIPSPPSDGQMLAFRAHATNGTSPTMTVDGGTTYPMQVTAGTAVPAGTLVVGTPYRMSFNLSALAWVLEGGYGNPYSIPLGGLLPSTLAAPPNSSFILPAGQCISTTTYAAYWVAKGSPASGACPGGQFAVLDMRGNTLYALDNLNGTPANRITSAGCGVALTSIGATCTNTETFTLVTLNLPPYTPSGGINNGTISVGSTDAAAKTVTGGTVGGGGGFGQQQTASISFSQAASTFTGSPQGGTSVPVSRITPGVGVSYFLRVL